MKTDQSIILDATDLRLLAQLQIDASLTNYALAAKVATSPATCLRRVKRLQETGVIERQVALINTAAIGAGLSVFAEVTLDRQGAEYLAGFEARAIEEPAVQQCHRVSPGPDFMLLLQVADMAAWHGLVQRLFTQDANVRNVKSYFSVHRSKFETRVGLPALAVVRGNRA